MDEKGAKPDRVVAAVASRLHGVVSTAQLVVAGLSKDAALIRQRKGQLHRVHRGVYAVGHPGLSQEGRWMAAVLVHDPTRTERDQAFLSHRSAAALWGLLSPSPGPIDVTIPFDGGRKKMGGIRLHRSRTLIPRSTTRRLGIPTTSPRRTIDDLRRSAPRFGGATAPQLRRAIRQTDVLGLPVGGLVTDRTRSDLELLFLEICRRHRLPPPEVNVEVAGLEVDFLWRHSRLIVETDGYRYHRGRAAFDEDRRRDLTLRRLGFEIMRVSDSQVTEEPQKIVSVVTCLLKGRGESSGRAGTQGQGR